MNPPGTSAWVYRLALLALGRIHEQPYDGVDCGAAVTMKIGRCSLPLCTDRTTPVLIQSHTPQAMRRIISSTTISHAPESFSLSYVSGVLVDAHGGFGCIYFLLCASSVMEFGWYRLVSIYLFLS